MHDETLRNDDGNRTWYDVAPHGNCIGTIERRCLGGLEQQIHMQELFDLHGELQVHPNHDMPSGCLYDFEAAIRRLLNALHDVQNSHEILPNGCYQACGYSPTSDNEGDPIELLQSSTLSPGDPLLQNQQVDNKSAWIMAEQSASPTL